MLRILLAAVLLLLSVSLAQAALCTVHIGDLAFGAVDTIGNAAATATADIDISCDSIAPGTTTITMCGNIGEGSGGVVSGVRQSLAGGQGMLGFALYSTSGTTAPVGSTSSPGLGGPYQIDVPVPANATDATLTTQIYGIVPASQSTTPVGDYRADFTGSDAVFTYAEGALNCSAPVGGTDAEASFAMTASIAANCDLETSDLNFGTAGIIGENIDADTDLSITCTPGTGYGIAIDGGGSHDPENRVLRSGGDTVGYGLYSDIGRGDLWGTASGTMVSGSGDGTEQRYGVYGRIPPQPAAPGAYADTVVVTITY